MDRLEPSSSSGLYWSSCTTHTCRAERRKQGWSNPGVAKVETALDSGTVEVAVGILEADVVY